MLKLHELIRMLHAIACQLGFVLLCRQGRQGEKLKLMKDGHFLVSSAVWDLFLKFLGK